MYSKQSKAKQSKAKMSTLGERILSYCEKYRKPFYPQIEMIDGVKVNVIIIIDDNKDLIISIDPAYSQYCIYPNEDGEGGILCNATSDITVKPNQLETALDKVKVAKYSPYMKLFNLDYTEEDIEKDKLRKDFKKYISCDNVNVLGNECCVCLEHTIYETVCDHHLCIKCSQQLKIQKCPICRRDFN